MSLRPPRDEDVTVVAELMSEFAPFRMDAESVERDWTSPIIDREHDVRVEPGAYALVEDMTEGRVWIELHGRPSDRLVDWAEARAGEKGRRLVSGAWSTNERILQALVARGYGVTRHAYRMERALDGDLPSPVWPEGVATRAVTGAATGTTAPVDEVRVDGSRSRRAGPTLPGRCVVRCPRTRLANCLPPGWDRTGRRIASRPGWPLTVPGRAPG